MKKITIIIMFLGLMTMPLFAGLISDPGFENGLTDIHDIGDGDTYYEFAEYTHEMWVVIDTSLFYTIEGGNTGKCVRFQTAAMRAIGTVIDDNAASFGDLWNYTVDLQNYNDGVTEFSEVKLVIQGLPDPWSDTGWKNRIDTSAWTFDEGVGTELLDLSIDPTAVSSSWTTFSGSVDLGAGYEYISVALRVFDVGSFNSSLRVDNFDIISIPEPGFYLLFMIYNLLFINYYRRK